jgi:hypothetical protein
LIYQWPSSHYSGNHNKYASSRPGPANAKQNRKTAHLLVGVFSILGTMVSVGGGGNLME